MYKTKTTQNIIYMIIRLEKQNKISKNTINQADTRKTCIPDKENDLRQHRED